MTTTDRWITTRGVQLHYIDGRRPDDDGVVPIVYVPGLLGGAEQFSRAEMEIFSPRRCVAVSLRGRGRSAAPVNGYAFLDHVLDLAAIVEAAELPPFFLVGYSVGVPICLRFATKSRPQLRGMVLLDYPARYPKLSPAWTERAKENSDPALHRVIAAIERESQEISLLEDLQQITCPVLVIRGGRQGALLSGDEARIYADRLPDCTVVEFADAAHALWKPDEARFFRTLKAFFARHDPNHNQRCSRA